MISIILSLFFVIPSIPTIQYSIPPFLYFVSDKIIIGIDPGSICCGYGLLEKKGKNIYYINSGDISLSKKEILSDRLKNLFIELTDVLRTYNPEEAVIERVFYAKGYRAALNLGHARGVALLTASMNNIPIFEYSALEVKKAVVGYGRADKRQVQEMIKAILNVKIKLTPDSADALALALCHLNTMEYIENS